MLKTLHIRHCRSLLDLRLRLGRVTVITGENGVGKSNVYRSLAMLQRLAAGRFAEAIAQEGGMPSLLWSGKRDLKKPLRVSWKIEHDFFLYEMECGLVPNAPGDITKFRTDPDVKLETLQLHQRGKSHVIAKRKGPMIDLRDADGRFETAPFPLHSPESMLSEIRDAARYPGLAAAREILLSWRFYHQFRTDADSALRRPVIGSWSPVLSHDGANLAATLQTIVEARRGEPLDEIVENAFPETRWRACDDQDRFQLQILRPGLKRWLDASEVSDGTLRFFCLFAALLSPKPPPLLVLNEPETSLHPQLFSTLANLVAQVPEETQIIIVTHSQTLAEALDAVLPCKRIELVSYEGETRRAVEGTGPRVQVFDDGDEDDQEN
ncbi:recombinase RecF [Phragmitibacter flavus]|uniref:Recombinase RecF n=1 Tax=Phragmitibacter flavus TaxID=2576071 RepID=A0A5R8KBT6_9BACT|nr:AAA family ATPase [Phragmitibacter flavus]TLD69707.1 recombinase RecF [Phragmitibacter flavus]